MVLIHHDDKLEAESIAPVTEMSTPLLRFSECWDLLGPFQIGTREASWGADPLECNGGFRHLHRDPNVSFPSSLASYGEVHWVRHQSSITYDHSQAVSVALEIDFANVDWRWLQQVYGWTALQYQAWARGQLTVNGDEPRTVLLYTDAVLEFCVDGVPHFGGDYYGFRRAPLVLKLHPGSHTVDVRVTRDVRSMGGLNPSVSIKLTAEVSPGGLVLQREKLLMSDVINGTLASPWASVPARNDGDAPLEILEIEAVDEGFKACLLERSSPMVLTPGQSRPVLFRMHLTGSTSRDLSLRLRYRSDDIPTGQSAVTFKCSLSITHLHAPHKVTFRLQSGIVSYFMLRAPSKNVTKDVDVTQRLPIQLFLHGAGAEADDHQVSHMLDPLPDLRAFLLYPTGSTPWSGDDWHDWGFADVKAAIASIPDWIKQVGWQGPQVDHNKWLVSGHSNGGQGTLYAMTHYPDRIIGAAAVSGYLSIQKYVPYHSWTEADSRITQNVQSSLQSFRHELLIDNIKNIPVLLQHGSGDDNVPTYHSRRLHQLTSQTSQNQRHRYVELAGKGHWYDGIMTTPPLKAFYQQCLEDEGRKTGLSRKYDIVVANPADTGSVGKLQVDQLLTPDQLGKVEVAHDAFANVVEIYTSNVKRFHFIESPMFNAQSKIVIDRQTILEFGRVYTSAELGESILWLSYENGTWKMSSDMRWLLHERCGDQLGPLSGILRTKYCFHIQCLTADVYDVALQVSRNLYQYFGADTNIVTQASTTSPEFEMTANVITLVKGADQLPARFPSHPVEFRPSLGIVIHKRDGNKRIYVFGDGLGAIFLKPLPRQRLELVIWGLDDCGLRQAARLMPMLTGVGQPDFIVTQKSMAWEGAAGALAMGYFDSSWQISEASFMQ